MKRILLVAAFALSIAACSTRTERPAETAAGVAPALTVERFLQAANAEDLDAMVELFGTADGPIIERTGSAVGCFFRWIGGIFGADGCQSRLEIERRMLALANILRHDDYEMGRQDRVPARAHQTVRVGVTLIRGGGRIPGVPFTVVRSGEGRWLVEEIGLEAITDAR